MRKEEFCQILGDVNETYIKEARADHKAGKPAWVKWGAMAACLCLVAAMAVAGHGRTPTLPDISETPVQSCPGSWEGQEHEGNEQMGQEQANQGQMGQEQADHGHVEGPWNPWQATFNSAVTVMDAAKRYIPGYFTEELSAQEIAAIEPAMRMEFMQYFGHAGFDGEGTLVSVYLAVSTTIPEHNISIAISQGDVVRDYVVHEEPVISVCEDVEYRVYQWEAADGSVTLAADATIRDYTYAFTLETSVRDLEQAKEDFTRVLECFAYYAEGKPDFSVIVADEIPEWFDNTLSHGEALADPSYGAYMLPDIPDGYSEESIRRYKDQASDYLSGLWTSGYNEIRWKVYTIREADKARMTGIGDRQNYDLSQYPIPRASSVPEELREVVDNPIFFAEELTMDAVRARAYKTAETGDAAGWRMEFSVKYGDVVVEVGTKGVDTEWVYRQLVSLVKE